ncbi:pregnancy-associated plasma protein-A [Kribbella steppae]|uniref:Pregnancy-associated plasma protein-A n=1 Tax=Kribbella steppae TaxID=2512223 RepID=A0A4R2HNL6_9ACTN|nr:zinc metalloprotease [Kribbella steppae]TCO32783.1 pregnancy-associated plasma protein-A [Kribbella steppae]
MRWNRQVVGVAIAAMVCGGVAGAPSQALGSSGTEQCDPASVSNAALAKGGPVREPDLGQIAQDLPASAKGQAKPGFTTTVPVYFHVITDGSIGAVTTAQIQAQIDVLNNTFAGGEGGDNSGFSFTLAAVTRSDNAQWFYANPTSLGERRMKQALHTGGPGDLNWYSTTAGDYLGWAYLPDIVTKPGQAYLDGVVVDWESMLGTSTTYEDRYDQGETGTHEVGHWLNLEHTFYRGCSAKGDFVADTPAEKTPTSGCPAGKDTCKAPGLDPIHNYMDYSYDSCYTQFTPGQSQRMADAWLLYRD